MRLAIISDIHANLEALRAILEDVSTQSVDRIICLGDIVGYNANPNECVELLQKLDALCVAGNHDRAVTRQLSLEGFPYNAARAIRWTRRHISNKAFEFLEKLPTETHVANYLVAVHGALHPEIGREVVRLDNPESRYLSFQSLITYPTGARICAFGHTHQLVIYELHDGTVRELEGNSVPLRDDGWYLINPGTVGQPRGVDRRATYLVLDMIRQNITARRVDYDTTIPSIRTRRAGLLPIWSYIPGPLRPALPWIPKPVKDNIKVMLERLGL